MTRIPLEATARALLSRAVALKAVDREGWKRAGVARPESVAAHSYGVALAALVLAPPTLDREKLLAMALLHDLAEVEVGDITPFDGVPREEKHRREREALASLLGERADLLALFDESLAGRSEEARLLHALDKLDMQLTAEHYAREGHETSDFVRSARAAIEEAFEEDGALG